MIGIICAMEVEVKGIKALMQNTTDTTYSNLTFTKGTIGDKEIVAVECGVGKVNAAMCTQVMIDKFSPDIIINSGVAGAVSPTVKIGDMIIGTEVLQHDMNTSALGDPVGAISFPNELRTEFPCDKNVADKLYEICKSNEDTNVFKGKIASGDVFVSRKSKREIIHLRFNALACEMEGGAIGHVCFRNNVPFCVFRVISDDLERNEGVDFSTFCKMASDKSISAIYSFIKNS